MKHTHTQTHSTQMVSEMIRQMRENSHTFLAGMLLLMERRLHNSRRNSQAAKSLSKRQVMKKKEYT